MIFRLNDVSHYSKMVIKRQTKFTCALSRGVCVLRTGVDPPHKSRDGDLPFISAGCDWCSRDD